MGLAVTADDRRAAALRRRGESWFDEAFAAFERVVSGTDTEEDVQAMAPFSHGRWDDAHWAYDAQESSQRNAEAAAAYYGAVDLDAVRAALAELPAPVLLVAGEYDLAVPPARAAQYAGLFRHAELAVQPGGGHSGWLDDPEWFMRTVTAFLRDGRR